MVQLEPFLLTHFSVKEYYMILKYYQITIIVIIQAIITTAAFSSPDDWPHFANTPNCSSIAVDGPNTIDESTLQWVAWQDPAAPEYFIEFEANSTPAVFGGKVYAYAKVFDSHNNYTNNQIICFDSTTGQTLWNTIIDMPIFDSKSSPTIDTKNQTVLIGSGRKVFALDCQSGEILWTTRLEKTIVNASVCLALDIEPARAFITDYDGFGNSGKLYCINIDPNESEQNPYNPGDIVWSDNIEGSSGNTPAYNDRVVYVASITDPENFWSSGNPNPAGTIHAYDAQSTAAVKIWETKESRFEGFFGGVCVTRQGFLYAANYDFYSQQNNSALCKIDCANGSIVWVTQTERTSSVPVVVGDKIYISGGIPGYGSRPKLQAYHDFGDTVEKQWETSTDVAIAGWTYQPVCANGKLYVGAMSTVGDSFGAYSEFYILDLTRQPGQQNFIIDHYSGCGSSPAVTYDSIYTIGPDGLHKFYQPASIANVNQDNSVDYLDLETFAGYWLWQGPAGMVRSDLNLDGIINLIDFAIFARQWEMKID